MSLPPFQRLLDSYGADVHRFLVASLGRADADDCYQETWLAALRAYPRLRDASNLRGWVLTVASRKAIDHARRRDRESPFADVSETAVPQSASGEAGLGDAGLPSAGGSDDTALWTLVRELPPKQRTAVALRFVVDAGYGEIAAAMGTSEEAARRNVHEGIKRLRLEYQP